MKKSVLLMLLFHICAFAQFRGVVKDSLTRKPIPYVGIWCATSNYSLSANKKGAFKTSGLTKGDELIFFTSGYELKKMPCRKLGREVLMVPKILGKEIAGPIKTREKEIKNDNLDLKKGAKTFASIDSLTLLIAQYIPYSPEFQSTGYLKKIQVSIKNMKKESDYKIRFFAADANGKPAGELVNEDIIGKSFRYSSGAKVPSDFISKPIDLTKYKIAFPKDGIFVALELMYFKENELITSEFGPAQTIINPFFMITDTASDKIWEFHSGEWVQVQSANEIAMKLTLTN